MNNQNLLATALVSVLAFTAAISHAADPLPSWNNGKARQSIVDFVEKVTSPARRTSSRPPNASRPLTTTEHFGPSSRCISNPLRVRPREGSRAAASRVEGQGTLRLTAQRRSQGCIGRRREGADGNRGGYARGPDHRGVREDREGMDRHSEASATKKPLTGDGLSADARTALLSARKWIQDVHRLPVVASNSCASLRSRSMASRPNKSSVAAASQV